MRRISSQGVYVWVGEGNGGDCGGGGDVSFKITLGRWR